MPAQPDLLRLSLDDIAVEQGRSEPRLWIRRLVIWDAPRSIVRDIALAPGLNIIWSPPSAQEGEPMGHGGGKTSFCRLVRYCLGEDSFGTQVQRELIARAFPAGYVGAEVVLDGTPWTVARPLGGARGHHYAGTELTLDSLVEDSVPHTGVADMRRAITAALMADASKLMPLPNPDEHGWETALAWLSRDQECRLRDALDWRATETQSLSPSRGLSVPDRLTVVRLLINSLRAEELQHSRRAQDLKIEIERARARRKRLLESRADLARGLVDTLGGEPSDEQGELWAKKAVEAVTEVEQAYDVDVFDKLKGARALEAEFNRKLTSAQVAGAGQDAAILGAEELGRVLQASYARAETLVQDATNRFCDACSQPLPPAARAFVEQRRTEAANLQKDVADKRREALDLQTSRTALRIEEGLLEQRLVAASKATASLEAVMVEQSKRLTAAKGHVTMTDLYKRYGADILKIETDVEHQLLERATAVEEADRLRAASAGAVARLSQLFDAVMAFVVPEAVDGRVIITEEGLDLRVQRGGPISTSAIESLKVVIFDLAALVMTIEGKTQVPAFLIHDSPREADLERSIYDRLFDLGRRLEGMGPAPLFQYIVTTTTAPPETARQGAWVKLELHSAPSEARLFKADL